MSTLVNFLYKDQRKLVSISHLPKIGEKCQFGSSFPDFVSNRTLFVKEIINEFESEFQKIIIRLGDV